MRLFPPFSCQTDISLHLALVLDCCILYPGDDRPHEKELYVPVTTALHSLEVSCFSNLVLKYNAAGDGSFRLKIHGTE